MQHDEEWLFLKLTERIAGVGSWRLLLDSNKLYWSDHVYHIHGVSSKTYTPELSTAIDFYHPEDRPIVEKHVSEAIQNKSSFEFELRLVRADQSIRWVRSKGLCTLGVDGEVKELFGIFHDITESKKSTQQLALSISAARAGVWDWDIPGGHFFTNDLFHLMLGEDPRLDALPIGYFLEKLHPDDVPYAQQEIELAHTDPDHVYDIEFRFRCGDGSYKWIRSAGQVVERDLNNAPVRMIGQHVDIDAQKKLEAQLREALDAAEQASKSKTQFLANMSHEIRTPMNGVLGMTELLLETSLSEDQKEYAQIVQRSARTLLRVINDILDISKIEANRIELSPIDFLIREFIHDVERLHATEMARKALNFNAKVDADVPDVLFGDPDRLRQVIVNLLGNAMKFTPPGGNIELDVRTEKIEQDTVTLRFTVTDTGIGIKKEKQRAIFDAFVQEDASTTRSYGGTGLGLAISSNLVSLMGGQFSVESDSGTGAVFSFTAVLGYRDHTDTFNPATPPCEAPKCEKLHILLVEDNRINQKVTIRFLERDKHTIQVAENGLQAIEWCKKQHFDLILMDIHMPQMGGEEATVRIRELPGGKHIPIIALTADAMAGNEERYLEAGMNDFISKPISRHELSGVLARNTRHLDSSIKAVPDTPD